MKKDKAMRSPWDTGIDDRVSGPCPSSKPINGDDGHALHSALLESYQECKLCDVSADELTQAVIITSYLRATRLFEKIDEAYAGEPFLGRLPAESPEKQRRLKAYVADLIQAMDLFERTVRLRELVLSKRVGAVSAEVPPAEDKKINGPKESKESRTGTKSKRAGESIADRGGLIQ